MLGVIFLQHPLAVPSQYRKHGILEAQDQQHHDAGAVHVSGNRRPRAPDKGQRSVVGFSPAATAAAPAGEGHGATREHQGRVVAVVVAIIVVVAIVIVAVVVGSLGVRVRVFDVAFRYLVDLVAFGSVGVVFVFVCRGHRHRHRCRFVGCCVCGTAVVIVIVIVIRYQWWQLLLFVRGERVGAS